MPLFIVRLRNPLTRSWGNEEEIDVETALIAAEALAKEPLSRSGSAREDLRAKVWAVPHDGSAGLHFYVRR